MKFIQLLSTIAALAIFATAPGVSAAGLRAGAGGDAVDKGEEEASGRRSLYIYSGAGNPGQVSDIMKQVQGMLGPDNAVPGIQGVAANFDDEDEDKFYNNKYNDGNDRAYVYAHDGDSVESYRGRRNLQGGMMIYGLPSQVPGMPGMSGMPEGVPASFNNGGQDEHYNRMYNHGRGRADAYDNSGESYYYNRKYNHGHNGGGHRGHHFRGY